jgi:hypothetical protein
MKKIALGAFAILALSAGAAYAAAPEAVADCWQAVLACCGCC